VQAVKRSVLAGLGRPTAEALEKEMEIGIPVSISEDAREGTKGVQGEAQSPSSRGADVLFNLATIQELIAARIPDRDALVWRDRVLTYAELARRTRRIGRALGRLGLGCRTERRGAPAVGVGHGSRRDLLLQRHEWVETMYGAWKARAAFVNVNYRYVADELRYVLATERRARDRLSRGVRAARRGGAERPPALAPLHPGAGRIRATRSLPARSTTRSGSPRRATRRSTLRTPPTTSTSSSRRHDGLPKGVLWRTRTSSSTARRPHPGVRAARHRGEAPRARRVGLGGRFLVLPPFMHGAGQWARSTPSTAARP
jgi:fatty-acyl-CoA synthase